MLDTSLWQVHWQGNFEAYRNGNRYRPIPPADIPIEFDKPLIAISTSSFNALPSWVTAGWISQKIYTGLSVTGVSDAVLTNKRVFLNRLTLFKMDMDLFSSYSITYYFPRWFFDLSIAIWQYTGTDDIDDEIIRRLTKIEQKVDDISNYGMG
jgi:hypothetical protein